MELGCGWVGYSPRYVYKLGTGVLMNSLQVESMDIYLVDIGHGFGNGRVGKEGLVGVQTLQSAAIYMDVSGGTVTIIFIQKVYEMDPFSTFPLLPEIVAFFVPSTISSNARPTTNTPTVHHTRPPILPLPTSLPLCLHKPNATSHNLPHPHRLSHDSLSATTPTTHIIHTNTTHTATHTTTYIVPSKPALNTAASGVLADPATTPAGGRQRSAVETYRGLSEASDTES